MAIRWTYRHDEHIAFFVVTNKTKLKTDYLRREVPRTFPDECTKYVIGAEPISPKLLMTSFSMATNQRRAFKDACGLTY